MDNVTRLLMQGAAGAGGGTTYIDDVFSTYLYTGNQTAGHTITNGIDLAGDGGMVWIKSRTSQSVNEVVDSARGVGHLLVTNYNAAQGGSTSAEVDQFNSDGFRLAYRSAGGNANNVDYTSWTFRKQKGFFDIVTYTGTGSARTIAHSLGSMPGMIIIKNLDSTEDWRVYHRSTGGTQSLLLNNTDAAGSHASVFNNTDPTASVFTVGTSDATNKNGDDFVAYVFAGGASTATGASSCSFNGTSGLNVAASTGISFGTGPFCVEGWVYVDSLNPSGGYGRFFQLDGPSGNSDAKNLQVTLRPSDNTLHAWSYDGNVNVSISGSVSLKNGWHHIAVVRDSNNLITQYVDGTPDGTAANITTDFSPNGGSPRPAIGHYPAASGYTFDGKISNLRVTVGEPVYTTGFKPSTEPLTTTSQVTSSSNVKLLCCNVISNATGSTVTPGAISNNGTNPVAYGNNPFDDPAGFKFGEEGDQNIVKCGSYVGNGSTNGPEIYLGWEPQWILIKRSSGSENWMMFDAMRGMTTQAQNDMDLRPDLSNTEGDTRDYIDITPTGFKQVNTQYMMNGNGDTYVYMAIRRSDGYVGKPAEAGTDVFSFTTGRTDNVKPTFTTGFPVDLNLYRPTTTTSSWVTGARLIGKSILYTDSSGTEQTTSSYEWNWNTGMGNWTGNQSAYKSWNWKRHAGFDVVTWSGDGVSGRQMPHSMGKTPEMIWVKRRNSNDDWTVYHYGQNGGINPEQYRLRLNEQVMNYTGTSYWNNTAPTSTHFTLGNDGTVNSGGTTRYIGFLFASVEGISKVGYYDGQNSELTITTGFQPRFLILKRVSAQSDWHVLDAARGWGAGDDNYMALNSTQAQAPHNIGAPTSTGFTLTVTAEYNGAGGKYIYYAHA